MRVAAFGGGVDSTAMLIGCVERGIPVDLILFADTGGEKPHTYEHVAGEKVEKLIGYDVGEGHRARIPSDEHYLYRYPLIEWGWDRTDCLKAIDRAKLPIPSKSACFFCPSSKKPELIALRRTSPDLAARAVAMERNAELTDVKGLGRTFAWGDFFAADDAQAKLFPESPIEIACECFDGDDDSVDTASTRSAK